MFEDKVNLVNDKIKKSELNQENSLNETYENVVFIRNILNFLTEETSRILVYQKALQLEPI